MTTYTFIDANILIYYAKAMGVTVSICFLHLNDQLIIPDAVVSEATRGNFPDAGVIDNWITQNSTPGPNGEPAKTRRSINMSNGAYLPPAFVR